MQFNEIKKVRLQGRIKIVTIPKNCNIQKGDFVMISKIENVGDNPNVK